MEKDILLVLLGWSLSTLSDLKNRDAVSKEKCLQSLCDLKKQLEKSLKLARSPFKTEGGYDECLREMEISVRRLNIERIGLAIPLYSLNQRLFESLIVFEEYDPQHDNVAYHPTHTLVRFQFIWGSSGPSKIRLDKIGKIQQLLSFGFSRRLMIWMCWPLNRFIQGWKAKESTE